MKTSNAVLESLQPHLTWNRALRGLLTRIELVKDGSAIHPRRFKLILLSGDHSQKSLVNIEKIR